MPHGVHKLKMPSGCQQRTAKKKRCESLKSLSRFMLQYVRRPSDDQGSSKDIVPHVTIDTGSTNTSSMHSSIEQIEPEEIGAEIHEIAVEKFETEVDVENDSCHDTVNVMMSQVNDKNWNI